MADNSSFPPGVFKGYRIREYEDDTLYTVVVRGGDMYLR